MIKKHKQLNHLEYNRYQLARMLYERSKFKAFSDMSITTIADRLWWEIRNG